MNELLIRLMNKAYFECEIKKCRISLNDRIIKFAQLNIELQMIYKNINKEAVVYKCYEKFIDEIEQNNLSLDYVRNLVNSIWLK